MTSSSDLSDSTLASSRPSTASTLPWEAVGFLSLTILLSLFWSHNKLMSQDEFFVLQTDSVSTLSRLVEIQRTTPISLDPLVYHVLAHAAIKIFGADAFAIRLPSILGYLLMQLCLFLFVRRIATENAATFALAFPALTATLFYSAEGRPYGLLLGLFGLTMLTWQTASRRQSHRTLALVILTLSVGLALNTHYFGVLLLPPLCAAEIFRTIERRRFDLPVLTSIFLGIACIVFTLPFAKAAAAFRNNYYNSGAVSYRTIPQAYRYLLFDYIHKTKITQTLSAIGMVLLMALLLSGTIRQLREKNLRFPTAELVFLAFLAALPVFGYLLASSITHSVEVRYFAGSIIAISALLAIAVLPLLRGNIRAAVTLSVLFAIIALTGTLRIRMEQQRTRDALSGLTLDPKIKAAILSSPNGLLYIQDMAAFDFATFYEPDPDVRSRIALVYSREQELRWDHHDTTTLTAMHMSNFADFHIVPYKSLVTQPGDHVFALFQNVGWDWTDQAFLTDAKITPLGPAFRGVAAYVRFVPQTAPSR